MKRLSLALCFLALVAFASNSALADTFNFSFGNSHSLFQGSGILTGTSNGDGTFTLDSVTGTTAGQSITAILAPGTFPVGIFQVPNDNILYFPASYGLGNTYFDAGGLSYELADGTDVNLFFSNGQFIGNTVNIFGFQQSIGDPQFSRITVSSAASPVPEPSTLALLGTGVLGMAGVIRRKFAA